GLCWSNQYHLLSVRLRTSAKTVPGTYSVTVTLEGNGQAVPTTYTFNVLPEPLAPVAHSTYPSPIPGKESWESNMMRFGHKFCDDPKSKVSRDTLNATGNFLTGFEKAAEAVAWYYDGGRVYQQVATYTNNSSWNHCALTILDPYRQWLL